LVSRYSTITPLNLVFKASHFFFNNSWPFLADWIFPLKICRFLFEENKKI
jgi:hypothetical protein